MNPKQKDLIDEFINYWKTNEPGTYLEKAHKEVDELNLRASVSKILQWLKVSFLTRDNLEAREFQSNDKYTIKRLTTLFKECPQLQQLFLLKQNSITWQPFMNDVEKEEIRAYIHKNHFIKLMP